MKNKHVLYMCESRRICPRDSHEVNTEDIAYNNPIKKSIANNSNLSFTQGETKLHSFQLNKRYSVNNLMQVHENIFSHVKHDCFLSLSIQKNLMHEKQAPRHEFYFCFFFFKVLSPSDRSGLIDDALSLARYLFVIFLLCMQYSL